MPVLPEILDACIAARAALFDAQHEAAFRLFNGFTEGLPRLVIDLYASTAIVTNYAEPAAPGEPDIEEAQSVLRARLPWLQAILVKTRTSAEAEERRGKLVFGEQASKKIREHGVWYAVNPVMHQDAGLYLDTRNLRRWALDHLHGKTVLNMFAYTGSLGVAALAGGAARAVQVDHNRKFLDVARQSYILNGLPEASSDLIAADFFRQAGEFKRQDVSFDCVLLDPPFFSSANSGVVNQLTESARLINKVRPLISDGGTLVAINNAVYLSGMQYMHTLEALCADGYLQIDELIPVPSDFTGYPETRSGAPIVDPAPFNHSTKIAILSVRRKTK